MNSVDLQLLKHRYLQLQQQYSAGQLSWEQFSSEVGKLQVQDREGNWWTVNPRDGSLLRYDGAQWVIDTPPTTGPQPPPQPQLSSPGIWKRIMTVIGYLGVLLPLVSACCWFSYASLSPSSEGWDLLTPLILAVLPIALVILQKPIDYLLMPIQPIRGKIPKPLLLGAAIAIPIIIGCGCASITYSGYGALRLALVAGILGAHVLTHDPEVTS